MMKLGTRKSKMSNSPLVTKTIHNTNKSLNTQKYTAVKTLGSKTLSKPKLRLSLTLVVS